MSSSPVGVAATISKGAFVRALEPVRGKRFLAFRKSKQLASRVLGLRPIRYFVEVKVDSLGYCTLLAFKNKEDSSATPALEHYRFVGPNIALELLHKLPEEIAGVASTDASSNCIKIRAIATNDLKRYKAGTLHPLEGDLYIVAQDSGVVSLLKLALLALGRSAQSDGQCQFGSVFDKSLVSAGNNKAQQDTTAPPSSFAKSVFRLSRLEQVQFARSVAVLIQSSHTLTRPGVSLADSLLKNKIAENECWDRLQKPPPDGVADEATASAALQLLLHVLHNARPPRPISFPCFLLFMSQADRIKMQSKFMEGEELAGMCGELLADLRNDNAVALLQQLTRVIKAWSAATPAAAGASIQEWAELLGPGLVDSFSQREHLEPLIWFLTSLTASRHRDKIFAKFNTSNARALPRSPGLAQASPSPSPPPQQQAAEDAASSPAPSLASSQSSLTAVMAADVASASSSSPLHPQQHRRTRDLFATSDASAPSNGSPPQRNTSTLNLAGAVFLQEDVDALTRLGDYLRQRLREEDAGTVLYALLKSELQAVERELSSSSVANMSTIFSQLSHATASSARNSIASSYSSRGDGEDTASDKEEDGEGEEQDDFTKQVMELWAESRREALSGTFQELNEASLMLRNTLADVRALASSVGAGEYKLAPSTRQTSIALVAMLEESIVLRLKLIAKEEEPKPQPF